MNRGFGMNAVSLQALTGPRRQKSRLVPASRFAIAAASAAALLSASAGVSQAASATWNNGAADNNWQSASNWDTALVPGSNTNVFTSTDNAGFSTTGSGTINLGDLINIQSIFFGAAASGVAGTNDSNAFVVGDSNDTLNLTGGSANTAGGVFIGSGVTKSQTIGASTTVINVAGTNTNFNNASTTSGVTLTIAGAIGHTVSGNTNLFLGSTGALAAGGDVNVTGNITSATGTVAIFKNGLNTATLSGTTTTNNAAITVRGGTLTLSGTANTGTAGTVVTDTSGSGGSATLNIGANLSTLNLSVGQNTGRTGAVYQTTGTVVLSQAAAATNLQIGAVATPAQANSGYYKMIGGSLTANEFDIAGNFSNSVGVMDVTGGTATSNGYITVGRGVSTSSGTLNITGGTVNSSATAGTGPIALNWGTLSGAQAVLNVGGGSGTATLTGGSGTTATSQFGGKGLNLAETNTAGTLGVANLLTNGTLTVTDVVASQGTNPIAHLNFNGGTLKATATNLGASFITNSANIDAINVYSNGGTVDNSGTAITIAHSLVAPVGQGVTATSISVPTGGSGYIGAPLVKLTGGTGTGATGYATISNGAVTGIVITSPGIGYTAGDTLTATFYGGVGNNGTAATTVTGITVGATTGGSMTFSGAGTTTLSATNTYTGGTTVNAANLTVTATGGLGSGNVGVTSAGQLTLSSATVTDFIADTASLSLANGTLANLNFASTDTIGSLILGGTAVSQLGTWGAVGSGAANTSAYLTGTGLLNVTAVPEPASLAALGLLAVGGLSRRRRA